MGEMADYLLEHADADVDGVLEAQRKTGGSKRHIHQQTKAKIRPCAALGCGDYYYGSCCPEKCNRYQPLV